MSEGLTAQHFPVYAMGTGVYGRVLSSPLFTAQTPKMAETLASWLNDYAAIMEKVGRDGPTLVTIPGDMRG